MNLRLPSLHPPCSHSVGALVLRAVMLRPAAHKRPSRPSGLARPGAKSVPKSTACCAFIAKGLSGAARQADLLHSQVWKSEA